MRILHTVEFYHPSKGGSQGLLREVSERLARRGHSVTIATSTHPERTARELNGVSIRDFEVAGNAVKGFRGDTRGYQSFISSSDADVMMNYAAQTWSTDLVFPLLSSLALRKVLNPLGYSKIEQRRYKRYYAELPEFLRQYDRLIYHSSSYKDYIFGKTNGLEQRAVVIPNGASFEEFARPSLGFRRQFGIETKYMFLVVANHYFAKGHRFVIDAFRTLNDKDCSLVIIGELPEGHRWYSCYPICRVASILTPSIKILRNVDRRWVVSAFQEADMFLFGSKVECAPLVMYESFASRTPFVTRNVGNVSEHLSHIHLVTTIDDMVSVMREFIQNPGKYRDAAESAYQRFLQQFTWESITDQYESLYESLLKGTFTR